MNRHYQNIITLPVSLLILGCLVISLFASVSVGKTKDVYRKNITSCINQERDALLKFKQHIQSDNCELLSSWGNPNTPDCCTWKGVSCSNQSGHVVGLRLSGDTDGKQWGCLDSLTLSPSLGELKHLKYLDLSSNYFNGMIIPSSIGSLINLVYLNLAASGFSGNIPHQLANLTRLTSLDLSNNNGLSANSLNWLSRLTSLRDINLGGTDLSMVKDWFRIIGSLPLLEVLNMDDCQLSTPPLSSSFLQSANLRVISLYGNGFNSFSSFQWLFNTSNNSLLKQSLKYLDLWNNLPQGPIPDAIGNLEFLTYLDLSHNSLSGPIPSSLGGASSLSYLDLSNNHLGSVIPSSIADLKYLEHLDLSTNNLSGNIPCKLEITKPPYFANFSNNNLSGSVPKYLSSPGFDAFQGNLNFNIYEVQGPCDYKDNDKNDDKIYPGLYVSIGLGIYTGFWVFCGTLTLKTSWRHAYFGFLDHTIDKIYVTVAIYLARFRRNSQV